MATATSAFSSDEQAVLERTLDSSGAGAFRYDRAAFDIDQTAAHIRRGGFRCVALQFPDAQLPAAEPTVRDLEAALRKGSGADEEVDLFVLADTTFDGFQVDFVAAQHLSADFIVHYGAVDLEAQGPIPVRFVLGNEPLEVEALVAACSARLGAERKVLLVPSLPYSHAAEPLAGALAGACPNAIVCFTDVERLADAEAESTGQSVGGSALDAADELARGRLLGRRLGRWATAADGAGGAVVPAPLAESEMSDLALLYVGGEDQTLSNLCMLLNQSETFLCAEIRSPRSDLRDEISEERGDAERLVRLEARRG